MSPLDRTLADYANSGITVGPHIMQHLRATLAAQGVLRAGDLKRARNGSWTKIAGLVIVRQRPGTAKGFCFITLEDETGTANAVVVPDMFQRYRAVIHTAALLQIEGPLQKVLADGHGEDLTLTANRLTANRLNQPDSNPVIHVRARRIQALQLPQQPIALTGHGYRMRVTPGQAQAPPSDSGPSSTPNRQPPNREPPLSLPKSHDFR